MDEQTQATIPPKATPMASPGAPRPITVCLKPIASQSGTDGTDSPVSPVSSASADAATVRLRPVSLAPSKTGHILPTATASSTAQVAASVQAAKSKTSRISLDSAIGVATSIPITPQENVAPKTIRLKRPTDLAAPGTTSQAAITPMSFKPTAAAIVPPPPASRPSSSPATIKTTTTSVRQTSRIPDSVIPTEAPVAPIPEPEATVDSSTVTQKKTLKIRRPGAPEAASVSAEPAEGSDGVQMTPISEIEASGAPISTGYKVFTITSILCASVAALLMVVLNWCLAADTVAPMADKNATASISINAEVSWPGKFVQ
ncbi:MAG: hypothetical protein WCJ02_05405 [bacterium]